MNQLPDPLSSGSMAEAMARYCKFLSLPEVLA